MDERCAVCSVGDQMAGEQGRAVIDGWMDTCDATVSLLHSLTVKVYIYEVDKR